MTTEEASPPLTAEARPDDVPPQRYTADLASRIESAWQDRWEAEGTFHVPNPVGPLSAGFEAVADRPHLFVMDMFPYPSGVGLHVGHPLGFIGTDVYARYLRMRGTNVLHTMGFDAFGLPAEQYAVQTGQHPATTTYANVEVFQRQLRRMGLAHDRRRTFATTDKPYYRWTQWIFLQIFNSWYDTAADRARPIDELIAELDTGYREPAPGSNPFERPWSQLTELERRIVVDNHRLGYRGESIVNWCPGLGTVLANEEVTAEGRSERGNFPVFRKPLAQWMLRITAYADRLVRDLDSIDWPDKVRAMQRNWIGRSTGARIRFPSPAGDIEVFTTRPDTVFGATYLVLAPEHPLVDSLIGPRWPDGTPPAWTGDAADPVTSVSGYRTQAAAKTELDRQEDRAKTGVFTASYATNPATTERIPVFVADYVLMAYGTGAIMAVPGQDERDWEFAEVFGLPIVRTVEPPTDFSGTAYVGDGPAINSGFLNGLNVADAKAAIVAWLEESGHGEGAVTYRLRDWLFSRQRYWGEPFPIVYDETGLPIALPDSMLPLELPDTDDFSPTAFPPDAADATPEPPLGRLTDWVDVTLDLGDGPKRYRRETDTMPNWAGSCWYELRYVDPTNDQVIVDPALEHYWMGPDDAKPLGGVDLYVGGVEHAVLHLLYARFWHKVLYDLGYVESSEPFHRLVNQGYVQAYAFTDARGAYVPAERVLEKVEGHETTYLFDGEPVVREYGKMGKSLRNVVTPDEMYAAYGADTLRLFEMFTGPLEQDRPWDTKAVVGSFRLLQRIWRTVVNEHTGSAHVSDDPASPELIRLLHKTIAAVREGFETLRFNTAIARITELNNALTHAYPRGGAPRSIVEPLVLMLAPLAPHAAEELWARLIHDTSLAWHAFPEADPALLVEDMIEVPVQLNGKLRAVLQMPAQADPAALEAAARADARIAAALNGHPVRRVVVVPGRLVNFVL
jgi:leucyl-tRNA synthetase